MINLFRLFLLVVHWPLRGYVISTLWGWFMVPAFGLNPIGIATGIGLQLLGSVIAPTPMASAATAWPDWDEDKQNIAGSLVGPIVSLTGLAMGAIVHWIST